MKKFHKILIIEPNWLGDIIFTTPAFKAIKTLYPNSFLGVILPKNYSAILENDPYIDKIYSLDEKKDEKKLLKKIAFIKTIKSEKFNQAIVLHRSFTKTFLIFLSGVKNISGYNYPKRSFLISEKIPCVNKDSFHKQDYYLNVFTASKIPVLDKNCRIYLSKKDEREAQDLIRKNNLSKARYLIGLNPFSNWFPKDWPLKCYRELIELSLRKNPDLLFFITGKTKLTQSQNIFTKFNQKVVDLSGKTSLKQLAGLYQNLDLVISGDSGPLHLAAAVNTKYIGLFGPTSPKCTQPINQSRGLIFFKNSNCPTPCYQKRCPDNYACMNQINPSEICRFLLAMLEDKYN